MERLQKHAFHTTRRGWRPAERLRDVSCELLALPVPSQQQLSDSREETKRAADTYGHLLHGSIFLREKMIRSHGR